jgi:phage gp37-like protein
MPTQLQPEMVENALVGALKAACNGVNVQGLTEKQFDAEGNLIIVPPAALVMFDGETLQPTRDVTLQTYEATQRYLVIVGARDLSGEGAERLSAMSIVSQVRNALAGLTLTLEDGNKTMPIALAGVERFQFDPNGTWYAVLIDVEAVAQFTPK